MNNSFVELTQYMLRQAPMQAASYDATIQVCAVFTALALVAVVISFIAYLRGAKNSYGEVHSGVAATWIIGGFVLIMTSIILGSSYTNRAEIIASPTAWAEHQALKRMAGLQ